MPKVRETFIARVKDTADPEKRGRIKVICPEITGQQDLTLDEWIEPNFDWGWFYVPDIGEIVEVDAAVEDDYSESPMQAFLEFPDLKWRSKRYQAPDADSPRPVEFTFTNKNYGKRRGFFTPTGHCLMFDDTSGDETVTLAWKINKDSTGNTADKTSASKQSFLTIDKNGSITIESDDGNRLHMNAPEGSITIYSSTDNTIKLYDNGIDILSTKDMYTTVPGTYTKEVAGNIEILCQSSVNWTTIQDMTFECINETHNSDKFYIGKGADSEQEPLVLGSAWTTARGTMNSAISAHFQAMAAPASVLQTSLAAPPLSVGPIAPLSAALLPFFAAIASSSAAAGAAVDTFEAGASDYLSDLAYTVKSA